MLSVLLERPETIEVGIVLGWFGSALVVDGTAEFVS